MIKTKPNPMSIVTIIIFYALTILGIVYAIFVHEVALITLAIILSALFFILGTLLLIGTLMNYEEINPDLLIVHRYGRKKEISLSSINQIRFYGAYITFVDKNDLELATVSSSKANLIPLLEVLEKRGIIIRDMREPDEDKEEL